MTKLNIILFILSIIIIIWNYLPQKNNKKEEKFNNKLNEFINKYYKYIIIILFFILIFTSTYKLGKVPYGLHVDEAGMAYDALSLANYNVDRAINKYPIYFVNIGSGQSVMYGYLTMILIKIFGYSNTIIRIPSVILRILLSISLFLIIKDNKNKIKNIITLLLLTICPYFIMQSRWGLDCNLLIGFITISLFLLYKSIKKDNYLILLTSGIFFGLSLYTYALSYLIIPIFLLITFIYLLYTKKITIKKIIVFSIPLFILSTPLILMILVNNGIINEIKTFITIPKLPNYRGHEISIKNIFNNFYILTSIFSYDNQKVFGNMLIYNATKEFGTIYYFTIPFTLIGIITSFKKSIKSIKQRKFDINFIFITLFISIIITMLIIFSPNINKANAIFTPIIYFSIQGIIEIYKKKQYLIIPIISILIINFILFTNYYFNDYNKNNNNQFIFATCYLDALKYSKRLNKNFVYIEKNLTAEQYIYVLLENKISPYEYNTEIIKTKNTIYNTNFYYAPEINENSIFILKNRYNRHKMLIEKLEEQAFNKKKFCDITVYYK